MPDEEGERTEGKKPKTPADEKRREQVLVGAAIAGVLLTVILIRRSGSSQAAPLPVSAPVGNTGGSSGVSSGDFQSLQNQVYGLQGTLSGLEVSMGLNSNPTDISTNPTPGKVTAQDVEDLFTQFGVAPATATESAQHREDRIARQVNRGDRQWTDVQKSIQAQAPH